MFEGSTVLPALYVHLPWCVRKCPYCDFNSHALVGEMPETDYLAALLEDFLWEADRLASSGDLQPLESVFFGGGTPSLFAPRSIEYFLDSLSRRGWLGAETEITLEANPGAIDSKAFAGFRAAGVNRLSLGAQSFSDDSLRALGRVHDGAAAIRSVDSAARHFENFNIDLMHGLPGQSLAAAQRDVRVAVNSGASHLSLYQLTIEPNTEFARRPPQLPDEATMTAIETNITNAAESGGFLRYEVSAFALKDRECAHNLNYWRFGDYLGIGAGAHSKLTLGNEIVRTARVRRPAGYMQRAGSAEVVASERRVGATDLRFEYLMNALRLVQGFSLEDYSRRTGLDSADLQPQLSALESAGLLSQSLAGNISTTDLGKLHLNAILREYLPEPQTAVSAQGTLVTSSTRHRGQAPQAKHLL